MIRTNIKDALRASIEVEDAALADRQGTRAGRRRASVKAATQAARRAAAPAKPAKPFEMTLAGEEDEALKALRDRLREAGRTVGKRELLRAAAVLLREFEDAEVLAALDTLPKLGKS